MHQVWDVTVTDLVAGRLDSFDSFQGIVFVGGFSYADVLDSAKGWAGVLRFNQHVWDSLQRFRARPDTFSLGVCNGCQLMALLGWVPALSDTTNEAQPRFVHNASGKFESRFSTVKIMPGPASKVMLRGMEDSVLGVWVAHGEGRVHFPDKGVEKTVMENDLAPVRYVDDQGLPTEVYPLNPNGSQAGIAALCSPNGRHLAMMPHPERAFLSWQWPWMPAEWRDTDWAQKQHVGPWLQMFQNARQWCTEQSASLL